MAVNMVTLPEPESGTKTSETDDTQIWRFRHGAICRAI